jgi:GT2 family glycosyltransferase
MEGISIIIPVYNKVEITLRCVEHIRGMNQAGEAEVIVVDNGSSDKTEDTLAVREDIVYIRQHQNIGIAKACNQAAGRARHDIFCFMHNDVLVYERDWGGRLGTFVRSMPDAGIVGLYGAKMLRRDGSFRGRTIVHAKKDGPAIQNSFERVAVVDGLLLAMKKKVFTDIGGFDEAYAVHYYDKDIAMRARERGYANYVLNMKFEHQVAGTRKQISGENMVREEARKKFLERWGSRLPVDERTFPEKLKNLFRTRSA